MPVGLTQVRFDQAALLQCFLDWYIVFHDHSGQWDHAGLRYPGRPKPFTRYLKEKRKALEISKSGRKRRVLLTLPATSAGPILTRSRSNSICPKKTEVV